MYVNMKLTEPIWDIDPTNRFKGVLNGNILMCLLNPSELTTMNLRRNENSLVCMNL